MNSVDSPLTKFFTVVVFFVSTTVWGQERPEAPEFEAPERAENQKITSFRELCKAYEAQKIRFQKNDRNESLLFETRKGKFDGLMVVKWDAGSGVVHFIQTMPLTLKKDQVSLFLEISQTLNHGFLFPGISVNLENLGTYYRLSVPVAPRGYLFDYEVGTYTKFALNKAAEFLPTIELGLEKKIKVEELLLFHQKKMRDLRSQFPMDLEVHGKFVRHSGDVTWELDFTKSGVVRFIREGKVERVSDFEIVKEKIIFKGQDSTVENESGHYEIFLSNQKLTFRKSKDPVDSRSVLLTGGPWTQKD
ncbi:MAG: hypothetical protein VX438_01120 [Planctomycetota bacterium]|jgi:hypothetical protein|nr:hypothetical protein [Planctomycetota bacterium]